MTRSSGFARISLTSARWLLPCIAVLFVSVTLAYAATSAISARARASDEQPDVEVVLLTGGAAAPTALERLQESRSATSALPDRFADRLSCSGQACNAVMPPSSSRFGTVDMTSPASTGHASPDGCCTWD